MKERQRNKRGREIVPIKEMKKDIIVNNLKMISDPYKKPRKNNPNHFEDYADFECLLCGKIKSIRISNVAWGDTISCGKHSNKYNAEKPKHQTHNMCHTRLCQIWYRMRQRCNNKNYCEYKYWGGRGIKVCDEWNNSFETFYEWSINNGYNDTLSIDRIDVNKNYEPSNCRWATTKEQSLNKRNTYYVIYNNEKIPLMQLCDNLNLPYETIKARLKRGWDINSAIEKPINHKFNNNKNQYKDEVIINE